MLKRSLRLIGTLAIIAAIGMASRVARAVSGASASGNFTSTTQFCKYAVTFSSSPVDISLTGATEDEDTYLLLYTGSGGIVAYNDDTTPDSNFNSEISGATVTPGAAYIIEASTYDYITSNSYPDNIGPFTLSVNAPVSSFSLISCGPGGNQGVTWFNPGDNRIDGQPGDRVVVWCNKSPDEIVVYGVGDSTNNSKGFLLGVFSNADLLAAGTKGITKNAGLGNGTISAMQDGNGNFYVAWNGGSFNATGVGIFSKTFSCFQ